MNGGRMVLVVDDEPAVRSALARALLRPGLRVREAGSGDEARAVLASGTVALLIADYGLPGASGLELLEQARREQPEVRRVLLTGRRDAGLLEAAINRAGIAYFLPKPWTPEALEGALGPLAASPAQRATHAPGLVPSLRRREPRPAGFREIIGESEPMRELLELIAKVADTDSTALITGETGTGKELVGRAIHRASRRRDRVFSAVNSAAFPETLLESELFGHRRGAFTGAASNKKGLFEHAHQGTVFLDEVAEMPLSMQAKLLRFLQTGEIRQVGDETSRYVDVRLVTATNKDLEAEVVAGRFREDLYYRLAVIPIHVPPLRERGEDIPLLAEHFLRRMGEKAGRDGVGIDDAAMALLLRHRWPGNVRELENVLERGLALCRGARITVEDLPRRLREGPAAPPLDEVQSLPSLEKRHILETLDKVGWNRKRAAALLQISTTTLWRRLKEFEIERDGASGAAGGVPVNG